MILKRLGNKQNIAMKIQTYFPQHEIYIEPFFGAGGMFFNKPKAKYNIVNDLDSDVFNLFQVVINNKDEFINCFEKMPIHSDLLDYWKENKETEPIKKALRFILISNMTWLGIGDKIHTALKNHKAAVRNNIDFVFDKLNDVIFNNMTFDEFFKNISFRGDMEKNKTFIYADPPYLNTSDNYSNSFTENDVVNLFKALDEMKCKFAYSEFDNEFVINEAKKRGLNINYIGERNNLKNRRTEILITNYENAPTLF